MKRALFLSALLGLSAGVLIAQGTGASTGNPPAGAPVPITLGQSVVPLYGPW